MTRRLGITVPLPGVALADHREWMRRVVDLGYSDCWTMETAGFDAFTPLAAAAAWAPELRFGTAIASVFSRGPALLAQSAAALADLAPGRFVLGIGSSSETMTRDWNAVPWERPYARVRDSLRFLRRALSGERVDVAYESFACRGFQLERPPERVPPIYLAALRPDMLRLAGREADGVMLSLVGPDDLRRIRGALAEGAGEGSARGEEAAGARDVVLRLGVLPTRDADRAREIARRMIAAYLSVPAYASMVGWLGRGDALEPIASRWRAGDRRGATAAVPDEWVDALFVHGAPEACRERIESFREAGVTTPVVSLMPLGLGTDELGTVLAALAA